jgi:hypothetical protein
MSSEGATSSELHVLKHLADFSHDQQFIITLADKANNAEALIRDVFAAFLHDLQTAFCEKLKMEHPSHFSHAASPPSTHENSKSHKLLAHANSTKSIGPGTASFLSSRHAKVSAEDFQNLSYWRSWIQFAQNLPFYASYRNAFSKLGGFSRLTVISLFLEFIPKYSIDETCQRISKCRLSGVHQDVEGKFDSMFDRFLLETREFQPASGFHIQTMMRAIYCIAGDLIQSVLDQYTGNDLAEEAVSAMIAKTFQFHQPYEKEKSQILEVSCLPDEILMDWQKAIQLKWANILGKLSRVHIDHIITKFTKEVQKFQEATGFNSNAHHIVDAVSQLMVVLPPPESSSANEVRINKVLKMYSDLLAGDIKKTKAKVAASIIRNLDLVFNQVDFLLKSSDQFAHFFEKVTLLSKADALRPLCNRFLTSFLIRSNYQFFAEQYQKFFVKKVLNVVSKKNPENLLIILRMLRGFYADFDNNSTNDSVLFGQYQAKSQNHPYCHLTRCDEKSPEENRARFTKILEVLFKKKMIMQLYDNRDILVEILNQMASSDLEFATKQIFVPFLKNADKCPEKIVLALTSLSMILDSQFSFQEKAKHSLFHKQGSRSFEDLLQDLSTEVNAILPEIVNCALVEVGLAKLGKSDSPIVISNFETRKDRNFQLFSPLEEAHSNQRLYSRAVSVAFKMQDTKEFDLEELVPEGKWTEESDGDLLSNEERSTVFGPDLSSPDSSLIRNLERIHSSGASSPTGNLDPLVEESMMEGNDSQKLELRAKVNKVSVDSLKYVDVFIHAANLLAVSPVKECVSDYSSKSYIGVGLFHFYQPIAKAVSHCLQRICHSNVHAIMDIFSCLKSWLLDTSFAELTTIITVLRQISICLRLCVKQFQPPMGTLKPFPPFLRTVDALSAAYLCHSSAKVRYEALQLAKVTRAAFDQLARISLEEVTVRRDEQLMRLAESSSCLYSTIEIESEQIVRDAQKRWDSFKEDFFDGNVVEPLAELPSIEQLIEKENLSYPWSAYAVGIAAALSKDLRNLPFRYECENLIALILSNLLQRESTSWNSPESAPSHNSNSFSSIVCFYLGMQSTRINANSLKVTASVANLNLSSISTAAEEVLPKLFQHFLLSSNATIIEQALFASFSAHKDHLSTVVGCVVALYKRLKLELGSKQKIGQEQIVNMEKTFNMFWLSFSELKRLRHLITTQDILELFMQTVMTTTTDNMLVFAQGPLDLMIRAKTICNIFDALVLPRTDKIVLNFGFFSGPFVETESKAVEQNLVPTLRLLRAWSLCGKSSLYSDLENALREAYASNQWKKENKAKSNKKPKFNEDEKSSSLFLYELTELRKTSSIAVSKMFSVRPLVHPDLILSESWIDWALETEFKELPLLVPFLCFYFDDVFPVIADRIYFQDATSNSQLLNVWFQSVATQFCHTRYGLSIHVDHSVGGDRYPDPERYALQMVKHVQKYFAPLVVIGLFFLGHPSPSISLLASSFLVTVFRMVCPGRYDVHDVPKKLLSVEKFRVKLQTNVVSQRRQESLNVG